MLLLMLTLNLCFFFCVQDLSICCGQGPILRAGGLHCAVLILDPWGWEQGSTQHADTGPEMSPLLCLESDIMLASGPPEEGDENRE